jgi:superoxide dismutase, Cu-Zn family
MRSRLSIALPLALFSLGATAPLAQAKSRPVKVTINAVSADGVGAPIGTITLREGKKGLQLQAKLKDLSPGEHGFHVHEKGSCDPADKDGKKAAAHAAGPHYDPSATQAHKGPGGGGHKGDLPKLVASKKGTVNAKLTAPGLTMADVAGRALMIHAGGDNYADAPQPLGGGGDRIACGVVPAAEEAEKKSP